MGFLTADDIRGMGQFGATSSTTLSPGTEKWSLQSDPVPSDAGVPSGYMWKMTMDLPKDTPQGRKSLYRIVPVGTGSPFITAGEPLFKELKPGTEVTISFWGRAIGAVITIGFIWGLIRVFKKKR